MILRRVTVGLSGHGGLRSWFPGTENDKATAQTFGEPKNVLGFVESCGVQLPNWYVGHIDLTRPDDLCTFLLVRYGSKLFLKRAFPGGSVPLYCGEPCDVKMLSAPEL